MNIFLMVVKEFISTQLIEASASQTAKSQGYFGIFFINNSTLSLQQAKIVTDLLKLVTTFSPTGKDKTTAQEIVQLIDQHYELMRLARIGQHADKDNGKTLTKLLNLKTYVNDFYNKLSGFSYTVSEKEYFPLLDKEYAETPEGLVYYYAARYLAEAIFDPKETLDSTLRDNKEIWVKKRLENLDKLIQPNSSFEERKKIALSILVDIKNDNLRLVNEANLKQQYGIPVGSMIGANVLGSKLDLKCIFHGPGRLQTQCNEAIEAIEKMSSKSFGATQRLVKEVQEEEPDTEQTSACVI